MKLLLQRHPSNTVCTTGDLYLKKKQETVTNKRSRPLLAEYNRNKSRAFREIALSKETKKCTKCGIEKDRNEFNKQTKNYDGLQSWCRECVNPVNKARAKQRVINYREKVFEIYGAYCCRCGFSDKRALQIDHVHGGGIKDPHRGIGFYKKVIADTTGNFQILCANCNWIKRHENNEIPLGNKCYYENVTFEKMVHI